MKVHELMTPTPLSVDARATIGQAWEAIQSLDVRHLPVLNDGVREVGADLDQPNRPGWSPSGRWPRSSSAASR